MKPALLLCAIAVVSVFLGPAGNARSAPPASEYLTRMGYYVYYDDGSWVALQREIERLDIVAPYFFHLTPNGSIKELDAREAEVTAFVKAHNKRIIPIIQNEAKWDDFTPTMESAEERERIARSLADLASPASWKPLKPSFVHGV
jgi:hypothetical protein